MIGGKLRNKKATTRIFAYFRGGGGEKRRVKTSLGGHHAGLLEKQQDWTDNVVACAQSRTGVHTRAH